MFGKSLKSILAVALVAGGAAFSTTTSANAGGSYGVYIGGGHGGVYYHSGGYHGPRHGVRGHRRGGYCGPRKAINKAWRMGVNRPHIQRVNRNRIVVAGFNHGYRAKVIFKRDSDRCRVIRTRGLR